MTRRLMLWLTGAMILFWMIAVGVGTIILREEFDEASDGAMQEVAQRLLPLVVDDLFQRDSTTDARRIDGGNSGDEEYLTYQLRDQSGRVLMHSHDAQIEPFDAPLQRGFSDTPTHRIYTEEAVSGTLFLQVADRFEHRREAVVESATSLLLPVLFLAPLSMLTIWLLVRRSLAPLAAMRGEIGARDGTNLAPMSVAGLPPELESIGGSVNRLLERLRTALEAERAFAANSAHELRTPIAGALAQTQRLISELPAGPHRTRARAIEKSLSALSHLAEKLLQLARADSGIGAAAEPVDVAAVVRLVVEDFSRKPENAGRLKLDLGDPGGGKVMRNVDVDALGIVLRNLVENALVHGSQETPASVAVRRDGTIRVVNAGQSIAPTQLSELTQRFKRGASPAAGSGLGLAIAEMLTGQMGATLAFVSPATGRDDGFEATLSLAG